jgi:hypothetical protein
VEVGASGDVEAPELCGVGGGDVGAPELGLGRDAGAAGLGGRSGDSGALERGLVGEVGTLRFEAAERGRDDDCPLDVEDVVDLVEVPRSTPFNRQL